MKSIRSDVELPSALGPAAVRACSLGPRVEFEKALSGREGGFFDSSVVSEDPRAPGDLAVSGGLAGPEFRMN